jgi:hypothetical protein
MVDRLFWRPWGVCFNGIANRSSSSPAGQRGIRANVNIVGSKGKKSFPFDFFKIKKPPLQVGSWSGGKRKLNAMVTTYLSRLYYIKLLHASIMRLSEGDCWESQSINSLEWKWWCAVILRCLSAPFYTCTFLTSSTSVGVSEKDNLLESTNTIPKI